MHAHLVTALDHLDAGDWDGAHEIAQADPGADASWLHAHLHRVEGDLSNAGYWYARAGMERFEGSVEDERAAMRRRFAGG